MQSSSILCGYEGDNVKVRLEEIFCVTVVWTEIIFSKYNIIITPFSLIFQKKAMKTLKRACSINDSSLQNVPCFTPPVILQLCNTHCKPLYPVSTVLPKE
jgi:hypothetical protein